MSRPDPRLDAHWRTVHRSKSNPDMLTHADLYDADKSKASGRNVYASPVVRVSSASIGMVKNADNPKGDEMVFLHFEGRKKKLGLNSTNHKQMEKLTGKGAPNQWVGAAIQLYVDPEAKYFGGGKGPAIRISPKLPSAKPDTSPEPEVPEADRERLEREHADRIADTAQREPGEEG